MAFWQFLKVCKSLPSIFKSITLINIFFVAFAVCAVFVAPLRDILWFKNDITSGVSGIRRLRLLTYEPSYYSTLLVPIALYYYLRIIMTKTPDKTLLFFLISVPLLLSLSFGVILALAMSLLFLFLSDIKLFTLKKSFPLFIVTAVVLLLALLIVLLQLFPENVVFVRIANVFSGKDTSFRGRTFDSFYLGWKIASEKSVLFGAGPGQVKLIGLDLFKEFYNFPNFPESEVRIPNSMGDTLAIYGIFGVLIRLGLQIFFFFRTRVYSNFLRLCLFLFVFTYQFTGSFITNIAEYVLWIMAFSPWIFREFDKQLIYQRFSSEGYKMNAQSK